MSKQNQKSAIRERQKRTGQNYTTARREVLSGEHDTSPAPFISQAASSEDPAVLRALADIRLLERHFYFLRAEFIERVTGGSDCFMRKSLASSPINELAAVGGEEKPKGEMGRWKIGYSGRGWIPAANSKMEAEFNSMNEVPDVAIPGTENVSLLMLGSYMISPIIFALDGKAWLRFAKDLEPMVDQLRERERIGSNWVRERNSDSIRAVEDWNARFSGVKLIPLEESERERVAFLFAEDARCKEERRASMRKAMGQFS